MKSNFVTIISSILMLALQAGIPAQESGVESQAESALKQQDQQLELTPPNSAPVSDGLPFESVERNDWEGSPISDPDSEGGDSPPILLELNPSESEMNEFPQVEGEAKLFRRALDQGVPSPILGPLNPQDCIDQVPGTRGTLGVLGKSVHGYGFAIFKVLPGTTAAKMKLERGDIIVAVNGTVVQDAQGIALQLSRSVERNDGLGYVLIDNVRARIDTAGVVCHQSCRKPARFQKIWFQLK